MSDFSLNTKKLDSLIKAFKNIPKVRVGVLGDKNSRGGGDKTNADIGVIHEFGNDGMPVRSFLRMPISDHLEEYLENSGDFDPDALKKVIAEQSLHEYMARIGRIAETVVAEAFASGGFGQWKPSNMEYKKVQQTLVESQKLRDSISSEVE